VSGELLALERGRPAPAAAEPLAFGDLVLVPQQDGFHFECGSVMCPLPHSILVSFTAGPKWVPAAGVRRARP
jgi:hypothetical protein